MSSGAASRMPAMAACRNTWLAIRRAMSRVSPDSVTFPRSLIAQRQQRLRLRARQRLDHLERPAHLLRARLRLVDRVGALLALFLDAGHPFAVAFDPRLHGPQHLPH